MRAVNGESPKLEREILAKAATWFAKEADSTSTRRSGS